MNGQVRNQKKLESVPSVSLHTGMLKELKRVGKYKKPKAEYDLIFPAIRNVVYKNSFDAVSLKTHNAIQRLLCDSLRCFGAHVETENMILYSVPGMKLSGRIDLVAGFYGNTWAIEIDSQAKIESINKLMQCNTDFKIQFFYTANITPHLLNGVYIIGKKMVHKNDNLKSIFKKLNLKKARKLY